MKIELHDGPVHFASILREESGDIVWVNEFYEEGTIRDYRTSPKYDSYAEALVGALSWALEDYRIGPKMVLIVRSENGDVDFRDLDGIHDMVEHGGDA